MNDQPQDERSQLRIDMASLKGLAHPLRVAILEALSTYGAATASQLGERLDESSGATSYHLRQLEKHGFVEEKPELGNGRERFWDRKPRDISLNVTDFAPDSAERAAAVTIEREWDRSRASELDEFNRRGPTELEPGWYNASSIDTSNVRLTIEQMIELRDEIEAITKRYSLAYKKATPGSRPVQIHFNAFPVMDGKVSPEAPSDVSGTA